MTTTSKLGLIGDGIDSRLSLYSKPIGYGYEVANELFDCDICGLSEDQVVGVIFAIIHFDRVDGLAKVLGSVLGQVKMGDCVILIDNGSPELAQAMVKGIFREAIQTLEGKARFVYADTKSNQGPGLAYLWLLGHLLAKSKMRASHLVLLADDDLLLPGWRSEIDAHLGPNNWMAWGFDYFNWITKQVESLVSHSGQVTTRSGTTAHREWLGSIAGLVSLRHSRQEHSSALAMSLKSLQDASKKLATLMPLPYGDVGLALVVAYADRVIYIDKPLGLIGRGTNYGMGKPERMAANHPTRARISGCPSHSKYLAATYVECLFLIGKARLIRRSTKGLISNHLASTYGTTLAVALRNVFSLLSRDHFSAVRLVLEDVGFLAALIMHSRFPWFYNRMILWLLGFTRSFSFMTVERIRVDFIKRLEGRF